MTPPARITRGPRWATIERQADWRQDRPRWVVRSSAGTTRSFPRYREAEEYARRVVNSPSGHRS